MSVANIASILYTGSPQIARNSCFPIELEKSIQKVIGVIEKWLIAVIEFVIGKEGLNLKSVPSQQQTSTEEAKPELEEMPKELHSEESKQCWRILSDIETKFNNRLPSEVVRLQSTEPELAMARMILEETKLEGVKLGLYKLEHIELSPSTQRRLIKLKLSEFNNLFSSLKPRLSVREYQLIESRRSSLIQKFEQFEKLETSELLKKMNIPQDKDWENLITRLNDK